ncbi:MAG: retropepsin-like aspartic protease [Sedimenticola sp.]
MADNNPNTSIPHLDVRNTRGTSLVIDVSVNGSITEAVVDTAAMVTLVSESFFKSLSCGNSPLGETVLLQGISDHPAQGRFYEGLNIRIGNKNHKWKVCVTPMTDNLILGIDFLTEFSCIVDLGKNIMIMGGQFIPAKLKIAPDNTPIKVSRVHCTQRQTIPPQSVAFVKGKLSVPIEDTHVFEPLPQKEGILASSVFAKGNELTVKFINISDKYRSIKKGSILGLSEPCSLLPDTPCVKVKVTQSTECGDTPHSPPSTKTDNYNLPEHMVKLYESSCAGLNTEQCVSLKRLLYNYSDVFAKTDMDLGCLDCVYHHIDTGNAPPPSDGKSP